ncbi:MAG: hypothetical protein NZ578_05045 [Candidatus Binatia bacterium]|nr:hypothetical protein [Candidatus Binatia bacterium]
MTPAVPTAIPLPVRVGILAFKSTWQNDSAAAKLQVPLVLGAHVLLILAGEALTAAGSLVTLSLFPLALVYQDLGGVMGKVL